jgi:hypothetical protein
MAQTDTTGTTTRILQAVAFLGVAVFLYWLYAVSEPTEFLVAEEDVEEIEAVDLTPMAFSDSPEEYEGERVRLSDVEVTQMLRQHVYFLRFGEEGVPVMARMADDLVAQPGFQPLPGDRGDLVGVIHLVDDELLDQWNQAGVFQEPEEFFQAQVHRVYLFATLAELQPPGRDDETDEADRG